MYYVEFGSTLKYLRQEKGITQAELGKLIGTTKAVISKYENSLSYPPYDTLIKISEVFKVSIDYLLGNEKSKTIDVSKLTDSQFMFVVGLVSEFEKANEKPT